VLFDDSLRQALSVDSALAARDVEGGTAPDRVRQAIVRCRERLKHLEEGA